MNLFLEFFETLALNIGSGTATVALILFLFGPKISSPDACVVMKYVYNILKLMQVILISLVFTHLTLFGLEAYFAEAVSMDIENIVEYGIKFIIIGGVIFSGFLMTTRKISREYGVVFTAGGWYTYALIHTAIGAEIPISIFSGIVVYCIVLTFTYVLIHTIILKKEYKKQEVNDGGGDNV